MTSDQINDEEGIEAEQIVVKITDQGYVTSHGDHYHYFDGKMPFDAIISEELIIRDPNYTLQQADIVNEVKDGYIIKVEGKYYLYLKDAKHTSNVRSVDEIDLLIAPTAEWTIVILTPSTSIFCREADKASTEPCTSKIGRASCRERV